MSRLTTRHRIAKRPSLLHLDGPAGKWQRYSDWKKSIPITSSASPRGPLAAVYNGSEVVRYLDSLDVNLDLVFIAL